LVSWYNLVARIAQVRLNDRGDVFKWGLLQSGIFSVHSMYSALICNGHVRQNRTLWKTRIPLKIKIFMWYLHRGVVLTKDNLAKRNWHGSKKCVFCSHDETIQYLFFDCHFAKFLWRVVQYTLAWYRQRVLLNSIMIGYFALTVNLKRNYYVEFLCFAGLYG